MDECECYDWATINRDGDLEKRFVVNCTHPKFGLLQGMMPKNLPFNTTDLIMTEYHLGALSITSFPDNAFPLNPKIFSISLNHCGINYLSPGTFQGHSFYYIRSITLTNNYFDWLVEGTFKILPYLENISMSSNHLQRIQKEAFQSLPLIHAIDLSHNILEEIQRGSFDNLPSLEILDLSYNWLSKIPKEDIAQLSSLKVLNLDGNFWNCSCEMSWILNFTSILVDSSEAICLHPMTLNGTALQQLTMEDFQHCFVSDSPSTFAVIVSLLVVCTSLLFCRFQSGKKVEVSGKNIVGPLEFYDNDFLGSTHKGNVFKGKLQDGCCTPTPVAIKKYPHLTKIKELDILQHLSERGSPHKNMIRYHWVTTDSTSTYIALELCGGNLKTAILDRKEEFLPFLTHECCLFQILQGIEFLHDLDVQHRDIKPQNILWKFTGIKSKEIRFIISDFDVSRFIDDETSHKPMQGTEGWSAPELWRTIGKRTKAVDIFSLGCVFYYVMTSGNHPFGSLLSTEDRQQNITDDNSSLCDLKECCDDFQFALAEDLIGQMIKSNFSKRPVASDVVKHPLFWSNSEMVKFYHRIGLYMRDKLTSSSVQQLKKRLEDKAADVFQESWKNRLEDKKVRSDVKSFKEHDKICTLLKVVRNKIEHFGDLGEEVRSIYQENGGVVQYFNSRFPKLLIITFRVEQEWNELETLEQYDC